jgi:hypothetical protein
VTAGPDSYREDEPQRSRGPQHAGVTGLATGAALRRIEEALQLRESVRGQLFTAGIS